LITARRLVVALIVLSLARLSLQVANGLSAEYFTNERFAGTPAHRAVDPGVSTRRLDAGWVGDLPPRFSVRWQGYLTVPRAGEYVFATRSDDGSRVWIGGRLAVDNSGQHVPLTRTGRATLSEGSHRILIEYEQHGGGHEMALLWGRDEEALTPVPSGRLSAQRAPLWKLQAARVLGWLILAAIAVSIAWIVWRVVVSWPAAASAVSRHPRMASLALFVLLAVVHTWPLASAPTRLSRNDNSDTMLNEWVLAWVAHQAPRAPHKLYDANIFYPERDTLAYSESMILQSAMAAPILWLGGSPVLAYNVLLIAGLALTGWSMCLVMARWTGDWTAAILSGILAGFNSFTITSLPHLQGQHAEFLAPALLALDLVLREARVRDALRLAGAFALQALASVHLLTFSAFALVASVLVRFDARIRSRIGRTLGLLALAAAVATVALLPYLLPYWRVYHEQGFSRSLDAQTGLTASWRDYLTTAGRFHYHVWASRVVGNTGLFPGVVGFALTLVALFRGAAFRDPRARMFLAIGIVGVVLSFGPAVPGYTALYSVLPPLHGIRVLRRFGFLALFAVAGLAGFGLIEWRRLLAERTWRVVAPLAVCLAALEPLAAPLKLARADPISPIYARLAAERDAVVVELPFYSGGAAYAQAAYMLNSTAHWQPMLNGYSGVEPQSFQDRMEVLRGFPDAGSLSALQQAGVTHVFVRERYFDPSVLAAMAQMPALQQLAALDGIVLYRLR
jgi:hypothetical protein